MHHRGASGISAVTLALAFVLISASLSPAAPDAPLADIRTTSALDNFNRANETPIGSSNGAWAQPDTGTWPFAARLVSSRFWPATGVGGKTSVAYWTAQSFSGDMEVWASPQGAADTSEGWRIGLLTDVGVSGQVDGYLLMITNASGSGGNWQIRRYLNGVATQLVSQNNLGLPSNKIVLFRRVGSALQAWESADGGANWTLKLSVSDGTYTTGLRLALAIDSDDGTGPVWDDFGGGGSPPPPAGPPIGQTFGPSCGRGSIAISGSCTLSDPVNTRTGFFVHQEGDLATPGTGVAFDWTRSYTSGDATVGALGLGWTHTYAASLLVQGNGDALARGEDGQQLYFTKQANGSFVGDPGALATLASVAGGYELTRTDQVVYAFDTSGRLSSIKDRNNQGVTLAYDGSNRLSTLTDAAGKQVTVGYSGASTLVSTVSTQDGRSVSYGYTSGRLTSFTDVRGKTWTYAYDAGGRLESITDPLSHRQVLNVYDANGRVQSQTDAANKTTQFAWDATNEIATVTDANTKAWKHDYDQGVLAKEIDPLNHTTQLGYDADLNTTGVTSPTSEQTTMAYDAAGNLLTATAPVSLDSAQKTFTYTARNDPDVVTDARGKLTDYAYNPTTGNLTSVTQDGIQVGAYTYDSAGRVETFTDGNEKQTTYTYFPTTGYLESATDALGNKTTYTYDAAGRVATRVDPKGNCGGCTPANFTWEYTYNAAGQLQTETDPLDHVTQANVYDDAGRLTTATDANQHTTSYTYDDANRILTETAPDPDGAGGLPAPVTSYTYDNVGNKLTETGPDPDGTGPKSAPVTTYTYTAANQLASETGADPDGGGPLAAPVSTYTYDANGNLETTVEPRGNAAGGNPADYTTTFAYDAAGRVKTETRPDPDGGGSQLPPKTTNTYDTVGNLASVKDGNDHTTSYTYDAAGRVLTVTAPDTGVTTYTYDAAGNVLTRRDDNQHTTDYAYDNAGRLSSETGPDPDGGGSQTRPVSSYTYDENGNRLTVTDPNGNATGTAGDGVTTFGYDRGNRLTSINYSDATPDVTFTLDNVGNRLTMADGSGTETRTYDNLDRLLTVGRPSNTFAYIYDNAGNITRRTYPGSVVTDYAYDALNRLSTVTNSGQTTTYGYDVASNLTTTTLPSGNGYVETRAYDRPGRLVDVESKKGAATLAKFALSLDPAGNPLSVVRTGSLAQTQTYIYDASDRLLSVCFQVGTCPNPTDPFIRWSYDKVGNRLTEQRPGVATTNYSYDFRDRLASAGATTYTYDQNGNELSAGTRTFAYDLADRLKTTTQASTTTTYSYDGDGVRLQASTGTQANKKTNYLWDVSEGLPQVALERDGNNSLLRRYTYGAQRISMASGSNTSYYIRDGLGSTANLTSSSGATQWTWSYEPYGSIRTETKASGSQPDNFMKFTGEYLDPTGLYHLRARQYDASAGRFLTPDPMGQSESGSALSSYVYSGAHPTAATDPSGLLFRPSFLGPSYARFASSLGFHPCITPIGIGICTDKESNTGTIPVPGTCVGTGCEIKAGSGATIATIGAAIGLAIESCRRTDCVRDNHNKAVHHIVARAATRAAPARRILQIAGVGIEERANKVELPQWFHARLHTKVYYDAVNDRVRAAASPIATIAGAKIRAELIRIGRELKSMKVPKGY
jgi:RHS repeat-associated protein